MLGCVSYPQSAWCRQSRADSAERLDSSLRRLSAFQRLQGHIITKSAGISHYVTPLSDT